MWDTYKRWPVYSKFFDNMGPIPHHMHQKQEHARLTGQEGKPESYYFSPQYNNVDNNFCYTFMGLEPGTTKAQLRKCLEDWSKGDNGILDLSRAYRLKRGSGWLIPPGVLHAPGSLCTYEPQWGSDVFGMYQSLVEGREVPWSLCVKDVPEDKKYDLDYIIDQLDWEKNVDTHFKEHTYLEPIVAAQGTGWVDKWIVYGTIDGKQLFSSKELTVEPGARCTLKDPGASGWITVQGKGTLGKLNLQTPAMIRFGAETEDEVFITFEAANAGVEIVNTGSEPLVGLRYFGPDVHAKVPSVGDYKKIQLNGRIEHHVQTHLDRNLGVPVQPEGAHRVRRRRPGSARTEVRRPGTGRFRHSSQSRSVQDERPAGGRPRPVGVARDGLQRIGRRPVGRTADHGPRCRARTWRPFART